MYTQLSGCGYDGKWLLQWMYVQIHSGDQTPLSNISSDSKLNTIWAGKTVGIMQVFFNQFNLECTCIDINTENCLVHAASASDF